jgi:hypothetical protein
MKWAKNFVQIDILPEQTVLWMMMDGSICIALQPFSPATERFSFWSLSLPHVFKIFDLQQQPAGRIVGEIIAILPVANGGGWRQITSQLPPHR